MTAPEQRSTGDNCQQYNCMPLVANGWGSTHGAVHRETGWDDLVITQFNNGDRPYNYPSDTGGWDTPKHPVCGRET